MRGGKLHMQMVCECIILLKYKTPSEGYVTCIPKLIVCERGSAFPFAIPQHFYQTEIKKSHGYTRSQATSS